MRFKFIDACKGIAIFLVILGHCIQNMNSNFEESRIWQFIYSFHMPLFMILSGMFFKSALKMNLLALIWKKGKQLFLPQISIVTFIIIIITLAKGIVYRDWTLPINHDISQLYSFWFLTCLFFCYMIGWISIKLFKKPIYYVPISILAIYLLPHLQHFGLCFMFPFFWTGHFMTSSNEFFSKPKILIITTILFFLMQIGYPSMMEYRNAKLINYDTFTFESNNLVGIIYIYTIGFLGSISLIGCMANIENEKIASKLINVFAKIGFSTLGIYLFQRYTVERLLAHMNINLIYPIDFLISFPVAIFEIVILTNFINLLRKSNILSFLFLGISMKHSTTKIHD